MVGTISKITLRVEGNCNRSLLRKISLTFQRLNMILGFDPGKDKCGIAVMDTQKRVYNHQVVLSQTAIATLKTLCQQYPIELLVMGNQTTAKSWKIQLEEAFSQSLKIIMVDERNSSLEARDRYWQMYPAQGLKKLIPQGMRLPPCPIDDIVAILLIERYLLEIRK